MRKTSVRIRMTTFIEAITYHDIDSQRMIDILRLQSSKTMCGKGDENQSRKYATDKGTWSPFAKYGDKIKNGEGELTIMTGNETFKFRYDDNPSHRTVGRLVSGELWKLPNLFKHNNATFVSPEQFMDEARRARGDGRRQKGDRWYYQEEFEEGAKRSW